MWGDASGEAQVTNAISHFGIFRSTEAMTEFRFHAHPCACPGKTTSVPPTKSDTQTKKGWKVERYVNERDPRTLLGALGLTTRSKDATRGSWHRY